MLHHSKEEIRECSEVEDRAEVEVKLLHNVQFVPNLAHNLISVDQLLVNGYSVIFDDNLCTISDKKTWKCVQNVE